MEAVALEKVKSNDSIQAEKIPKRKSVQAKKKLLRGYAGDTPRLPSVNSHATKSKKFKRIQIGHSDRAKGVKKKMGRGGPSEALRMDKELLKKVDEAVRTVKDELGQKRFCDRRAFLDEAVRKFLISQMPYK